MVGGSITVSQDVLNYRGKRRESLRRHAVGRAGGRRLRRRRVEGVRRRLPEELPGVGRRLSRARACSRYVYYQNMKAALDGLDAVKGDLSGGQAKYREALAKMTLKTPTGDVKLDSNRQAIGTTFVTEVVKDAQGQLLQQGRAQGRQRRPDARHEEGGVPDRLARRAGLPVNRPTGGFSQRSFRSAQLRHRAARTGARAGAPRRVRRSRRTTRWCCDGVTRAFGALRAVDDVSLAVAAGREVRDPRRQRRRQDDAVQRHHRRLSADRRADPFLRRGHHRAAAVRAHPQGPAAHLPVVAAVSRADGARQPVPRGARRRQRPLQLRCGRARGTHASQRGHRRPARARAPGAHRRRDASPTWRTASSASSRSAWRWPARRG